MPVKVANNAASLLQNNVRAEDTHIVIAVKDMDLFPSLSNGDWFPLTITAPDGIYEIVHVTARDHNHLTVKRGCENTTAQAFTAGSRVDLRLTAAATESCLGNYYGARTTPPNNAQLGAFYLDRSQKPSVTKVLTEKGWEATTTVWASYGELITEMLPTNGSEGPFMVSNKILNTNYNIVVGGKLLYFPDDYMARSIPGSNPQILLNKNPNKSDWIVFMGYERLPVVDVLTRPEFIQKLENFKDVVYKVFGWAVDEVVRLGGATPPSSFYPANSPTVSNASMAVASIDDNYPGSAAPMRTQTLGAAALNDKRTDTGTPSTKPTQQALLARLAQLRWQAETGGIDIDGLPITTDQGSQTRMHWALIAAENDPNFTINWKTSNGFVVLDAQQIKTINNAMIAHMAACFDCEATVASEIEQGQITAFEQLETRFQSCIEECFHDR